MTADGIRSCLLVAYYYPPGGGVGVQRALKFSRYLPEFGWRPIVLTAESPLGIPSDPSLTVPDGTVLHRVAPTVAFAACFEANRSFLTRVLAAAVLVPDPAIGWFPAAFRRGLEVIRSEKPEVIVVTSPPSSSQLLGWALSMVSGLPLVADFRDAWLTDPDRNRALHNRVRTATIEKLMEAIVIRRAAQVISVSDAILDDFRTRFPAMPTGKFNLIENGFDDDDFALVERMDLGPFAVVLTGSMNKSGRAAAPLLRAVAELLRTQPDLSATLRVFLVGPSIGSDRELADRLGLTPFVSFVGWVSHGIALSYQCAASVNVMLWDGPDDARSSQMMSSKLFEYLGSRRAVLAAVPASSAAARLLGRIGGIPVVAPSDIMGLAAALKRFAVGHGGAGQGVSTVELEPFTRRHQAGMLAAVLTRAATQTGRK